ncbi:MAG TPA: ABC-type transport auxiliary lipoprotein family protein [Opitutaceae bacterium]
MRTTACRLPASVLSLLASVLWLGGCTLIPEPLPDPTRYYVLSEAPPPANFDAANASDASSPAGDNPAPAGLRVGLRTIELAPYLKGRSMVVRHGTNELAFNEYARWAEPLDAAVSGLVRAELLTSPKIGRVSVYPFRFDEERDCDVNIRITRCEGAQPEPAGPFVTKFAATIEIAGVGAEPKRVTRRVFIAPETPWDGKDFGALAAALSEAVRALAEDVAAALPAKG